MQCPGCHATDVPVLPGRYPSSVVQDLSRSVVCDGIFRRAGVRLCSNCMAYYSTSSDGSEIVLLQRDLLVHELSPGFGRTFSTILDYPADLIRVISNELRRGNAFEACTTSDDGIEVACMSHRFLDGHITSSWTEFQMLPDGAPWYAWYLAPSARRAVACMRMAKNSYA